MRIAASPTIPNQATDELLDGFVRLAREHGVGIHTHLAESKVQVIESRRRHGRSIVARLAEHGVLGPGFVGAHGIWLGDDDIRMLADAGAAVAHNPGSNLRLGCGIAPVRELLDRGVAVGLGTDGSVCADNQNLFEALRIASVISTIRFPHETEPLARRRHRVGAWRRRAAPACSDSPPTWARSRRASRRTSSCCARTRSSSSRSPIRSRRSSTPRPAPAWTPCWSAAAWSWSGAASPRWTRTASTPARKPRPTASARRAARPGRSPGSSRPYVGAACRAAVATPLDFNRYAAPIPHAGVSAPDNLGDLFDGSADPEKIALIDLAEPSAPREWTHGEIDRAARAVARGLVRARTSARRPHRHPLRQPRGIPRGLSRHHARGHGRGAGELQAAARHDPLRPRGRRRPPRLRRRRAAGRLSTRPAGGGAGRSRLRGVPRSRPVRHGAARRGRGRDVPLHLGLDRPAQGRAALARGPALVRHATASRATPTSPGTGSWWRRRSIT